MSTKLARKEGKDVARSRERLPFEDMDRMFDALISRGWMRPFGWTRPHWDERDIQGVFPRFDVIDRDRFVEVRAEVPGVDKDNLEVSLMDNILTVKGKTYAEEKEEEEGEFFRSEITRGEFSRSVSLPCDVDVEKATTKFKGGMLLLKLPKLAATKRRRIEIT